MAAMAPEQRILVRRVLEHVDDEPDVREVSMFGGRAIMVNNKMIVSVGRNGDLLVRVAAETWGSAGSLSPPRSSPTTAASPSGLTWP